MNDASDALSAAHPAGDGLEVEGLSIPGVDSEVILAMAELDGAQTINPAWLWFEDEHNHMSLGRWQSVPCQAPYIRGDLVLAAISAFRSRELANAQGLADKHQAAQTTVLALDAVIDRCRRDAMTAEARADAAEAEVKRLREALGNMRCPRPCNHRPDDFDAKDCVAAGECGCGAHVLHAALTKEGGNGE